MRWLMSIVTFGFVCISWVFFRSESFSQAWTVLSAMFALSGQSAMLTIQYSSLMTVTGVMLAMLSIHWCLREQTLEAIVQRIPWWWVSAVLAAMMYAIATLHGEDQSFIYFQF